jgi:hypothetical protein
VYGLSFLIACMGLGMSSLGSRSSPPQCRSQWNSVYRDRRVQGTLGGYRAPVGVLDRLKGVTKPDEGMDRLRSALAPEHRIRVPLYANEKLIGDTFAQRVPNVVQMLTGGELTLEVGAGYMSFASAKATTKATSSQTIAITPMVQVLMLEDGAAQDGSLIDLAERPGRPGDGLLTFVGAGQILGPDTDVSAVPENGLNPDLADRLQAKRREQEQWMDLYDGPRGTFVWLGVGAGPVASIASLRHADIGSLASYAPMPPFGILGLYEGEIDELTMIAPLMVWHHAGGGV